MLTVRGVVIMLVAGALTVAGAIREELGSLLWGGGMLLVVLVAAVVALVGRARLRAARNGFAAELRRSIVQADDSLPVHVTVPRLMVVPGFRLEHEIHLEWAGLRHLHARHRVIPGRRTAWTLTASDRGDFRAAGTKLVLEDRFGLTRSSIADDHPLRLLVLPGRPFEVENLPVRRGGETVAESSDLRVRSEELREVRPYVPGDDIRRVSWKHLAAHDDLLIRVGEFIPPSLGEVVCRIDDSVPAGSAAVRAGDALMEALVAVLEAARRRRLRLVVRFPHREPVTLEPAEADLAMSANAPSVAGPAFVIASEIACFVPGHPAAAAPHAAAPRGGTVSSDALRPGSRADLLITTRSDSGAGALSVAHLLGGEATPQSPWWWLLRRAG